MLTVRAILKDNTLTFLEELDLPVGAKQPVLITFLDKNITEFGDLTQQDLLKMVDNLRFRLTDKEIAILRLARQGMTNRQIADDLTLGIGTVRNHLSAIYEKLKVFNRTGAIAKAIEHGLLD